MEHGHPDTDTRVDPGRASAEDGKVLLDGPNGTALTMTPEAAIGTAWSLIEAARSAHQHQSTRP